MCGWIASILWVLTCLRWFDAGQPWRPAWLDALPPWAPAGSALVCACAWARGRWSAIWGTPLEPRSRGVLIVVALAVLFRLPLAWWGAAAYTTADGALSGIMAVHLREGSEHAVFLPHIPYSGTLKSHLTAPLSLLMDTPRAFALASVAFYAAFVALVYRLAFWAGGAAAALGAGVYVALSPTFVTHYSLSNDGNYVEILAFGTGALALAVRFVEDPPRRATAALSAGLLLGLGFWCHVLVVIHAAAVVLVLVVAEPRAAPRSLARLLTGFALGSFPALLWNASNDWDSFRYVIPGGHPLRSLGQGPGWAGRAALMVSEQWPVLLGYDPGYAAWIDALVRILSTLGVGLTVFAAARAVVGARSRFGPLGTLLVFTAVNLLVAVLALPYVPSNPRYILFLAAPVAVFLARELCEGWRRWVLALLVAFGAVGSVAQGSAKMVEDRRWRRFVADLEGEGVRWCYTDFYLATRINFLSGERVVCCSKLGPTLTEYFFEYRAAVERSPEAAFVPVNGASAEKVERRLERLGVTYERRDLLKPVLLRLSKKVDPKDLFPDKDFPLR